jgi:hypothetical protein
MMALTAKLLRRHVLNASAIACLLISASAWAIPWKSERAGSDESFVKEQTSQTAIEQPHLGSVSGNEYTNDFFGMTYTFPKTWLVDRAAMDEKNASAKKFFASQSGDHSAVHQSYTLLMVSRSPEEIRCEGCSSIRVLGPRIMLSAGTLTSAGRDQTAADIQDAGRRLFDGRPGYQVIRGPAVWSSGNQTFSRMDAKVGAGYEGDAIVVRQGYWIEFKISADTPEQLEELYDTLNSLQFKS